jgi:hypothetical protein
MKRQRWLRSSYTCELRPIRHLGNRIVYCNDCVANRTLWVSASGTLDCSVCGSQNWMHLAVPLANRSRLDNSCPRVETPTAKASRVLGVLPASVARAAYPGSEDVERGLDFITLRDVTAAAGHCIARIGLCSRAAVQSIHEISGQLRTPLRGTLLRIQQVFRNRFCCIRNWLAPAKQT